MPIYFYTNPTTGEIFEAFARIKDYKKPFQLADGTKCPRHYDYTTIQVCDKSRIRLNGDPKKEAEYKKRAKDPERARKARKDKFGHEGISITQSPYYKKEKRIKAQGNNDVDKKSFIQAAARNPNAMNAALKITKKSSE